MTPEERATDALPCNGGLHCQLSKGESHWVGCSTNFIDHVADQIRQAEADARVRALEETAKHFKGIEVEAHARMNKAPSDEPGLLATASSARWAAGVVRALKDKPEEE